jgi:hypothetical protein
MHHRSESIKDQVRTLQEEQRELDRKMAEAVKAQCPECKSIYAYDFSVHEVISHRQKRFERELLAENEQGQRILQLQNEQEELLDTVWLATSSVQIKELWNRVTRLLNQPPTNLQQEALDIPADSSSSNT